MTQKNEYTSIGPKIADMTSVFILVEVLLFQEATVGHQMRNVCTHGLRKKEAGFTESAASYHLIQYTYNCEGMIAALSLRNETNTVHWGEGLKPVW